MYPLSKSFIDGEVSQVGAAGTSFFAFCFFLFLVLAELARLLIFGKAKTLTFRLGLAGLLTSGFATNFVITIHKFIFVAVIKEVVAVVAGFALLV